MSRLTIIKALNRLGNGARLALLISACALLPGLMMMLDGSQFLFGFLLVLLSGALATAVLLPAWRSSKQRSDDSDHDSIPASGDEFYSLRAALKAANQSHAVSQLNSLNTMRKDLRVVLEQKFQIGELTFNRYLDSTERVYAIVLTNIESIADKRETNNSHAQDDETIAELLNSNDHALKSLALVINSLSAIETNKDKTTETREMKEAVKDLNELARRSDRYHKG